MAHGGYSQQNTFKKNKLKQYNITRLKIRNAVERHMSDDSFSGLREEIGLLRMALETKINLQCDTELDLAIRAPEIGAMVDQIQKALLACQKLEERSKQLMSLDDVMHIAARIIEIVSNELTAVENGAEIIENISQGIIGVIKDED